MAKFDLTRKSTWRKMISIGLSLLLVAGAIFGVVKLAQKLKDETKEINPSYTIGVLDETTGKPDKDAKTSIYTTDSFSAKGLEVIMDFDANVTYQIFWYDSQGNFRYCTEELSKGGKFYAPYKHTARVEITPIFDEADENKISWYEKLKYSSQLEIRVDKNQKLEKGDYSEVALSHSMWDQVNDSYYSPVLGDYVDVSEEFGDKYSDYPPVRCYSWTSDGMLSAMYVEKYTPADTEDGVVFGLHVRLIDGTSVYYYSSEDTSHGTYANDAELPTFEKPLEIPKGATVYLWAHFDADEAKAEAETVLCFY